MTIIAAGLFPEAVSPQSAHHRLLLVDDDEVVRQALTTVLAGYGFTVVAACTVNQALGLITEQAFDVLLSDLHISGAGDGVAIVSEMRQANPVRRRFHLQRLSGDVPLIRYL